MMRKDLFRTVRELLEVHVPEVKHIDLWNQNVEFIEEETAWERPAVFVEFGPIAWTPLTGGGLMGQGQVRVHIVTDWNEGGQEASWYLGGKIDRALYRSFGDRFKVMALVETATNHNHEELLESIDTFDVRYYDMLL